MICASFLSRSALRRLRRLLWEAAHNIEGVSPIATSPIPGVSPIPARTPPTSSSPQARPLVDENAM